MLPSISCDTPSGKQREKDNLTHGGLSSSSFCHRPGRNIPSHQTRKHFFSLKEKNLKKSPALLIAEIVGNKCASSLPRVRYSSRTFLLTCNVCLQIRGGWSKAQMPSVPQHHIFFYLALTSLWFLFSLYTTLHNTQLSITPTLLTHGS